MSNIVLNFIEPASVPKYRNKLTDSTQQNTIHFSLPQKAYTKSIEG